MSGNLQNIKGTIVLAGAGKMGSAMLSGWLARGLDPNRAAVIEPHLSDDIRAHLAKGVRLNPSPQETGSAAAFVVALKPQAFRDAAAGLKPYVDATTLVVSIMAGMTIASLSEVLGSSAAMPEATPTKKGGSTFDTLNGNVLTR